MLVQPLFTPVGFGSQLGKYGWVFVVAAVAGLIAKENVIATFATLGACLAGTGAFDFSGLDLADETGIPAVVAMIKATGITIPALISFIAFNMTTSPCFAAVGTAKAELQDNRRYKWTLFFWISASYAVACMVYTIGSWWWTCFIWAAAIAAVTYGVILYNKRKAKKLSTATLA